MGNVIQVGAWGCFDEFNRLEERMLSAVSQQVQTIQEALKSQQESNKDGSTYPSTRVQVDVYTFIYFFYHKYIHI
jgi:dynein heavy chain 1